jgi:glycosyltransferase involved in cell wall biosynthesis
VKIVLFANTDWYLFNFRLALARELRRMGHDLLLLSPPGEYGKKLREMGFRWEPVQMRRRSLNPAAELLLLLSLVRLFRREKPSLVHGFTIKCSVYGALAARISGVRGRVSAITGLGYVFTSTQVLARLLRPLVRTLIRFSLGGGSARLILQNDDDRFLFERERLSAPGMIRVIPGSGVDCARFAPRPRARKGDRPRVLLAARMLWDKGIGEYAEAARMLALEGREVDFLLAGTPDKGNPASVPMKALEDWHREGRVVWLGHVDDMAALLETVDLVVLPSYREGLPKGLIEAAACALPIVATDVPGCREVVRHRKTGLLVQPRDAEMLATAIMELLSDPGLARDLGSEARRVAVASYSDAVIVAQTVAVYSELVEPV